MEKLIVTVATTGHGTPLSKYPRLPIQPRDIANEVYECYKEGASTCHIHTRTDDGEPSVDLDRFREIIDRIRDLCCDIVINCSTGGMFDPKLRMQPVTLRPDMVSYNAGSMNFGPDVFYNPKGVLEELGRLMEEYDVKPEVEVFDSAMLYNAIRLSETGHIKQPIHFQFCLGADGGMAASPESIMYLKNLVPEGSTWSVLGLGRHAPTMWSLGIMLGGHVRFGTEDNIYLRRGKLATRNVDFMDDIKYLADFFGRQIATPKEAREILGLRPSAS